MRDKRRALGRALDDTGTRVDTEIAFVRMLADLDSVHIRVLKIMGRRPKHLDRVAAQMNAADDPKTAPAPPRALRLIQGRHRGAGESAVIAVPLGTSSRTGIQGAYLGVSHWPPRSPGELTVSVGLGDVFMVGILVARKCE